MNKQTSNGFVNFLIYSLLIVPMPNIIHVGRKNWSNIMLYRLVSFTSEKVSGNLHTKKPITKLVIHCSFDSQSLELHKEVLGIMLICFQTHYLVPNGCSCQQVLMENSGHFSYRKMASSPDHHTNLSFIQLLWHLERELNKFCNLGSESDIMNKRQWTILPSGFQFVLPKHH